MADKGGKKDRGSPYKKVSRKNVSHTGYISMALLNLNKAYKMTELVHTKHEKYGDGELATLVKPDAKWKVQLPAKYLRSLTDEDVEVIRNDCGTGNCPYVVYRGKMDDRSFKMDLIPKGSEIDQQYATGVDVPPYIPPDLNSSDENGTGDANTENQE